MMYVMSANHSGGFSAYLQEYKLLFDTGSNGRILLKNMDALGVDVMDIEHLFISHSHWDHIGGIDSILELNPNLTLYLPQSLSQHLIEDLRTIAKNVIVCSSASHLFGDLYTTGLLGTEMPEQSLIVDGEALVEVITGCGHYGVDNIVKSAQKTLGKNIDKVSGGFHLLRSEDEKIFTTIENLKVLGVSIAQPTHCSGDRAIELFQKNF